MTKLSALLLAVLAVSATAFADDLDSLESLAGSYHILQFNDDHSPTGTLEIVAGDSLGIRVTPLKYPKEATPSNNVPEQALLSPKGMTEVVKEGVLITQTADLGDRKIEIRYENYGDFLIIQGTDCGEGCTANKLVVGQAGSFGSSLSGKKFFERVNGMLATDTAGGIPAKASTAEFGAMMDYEDGVGLLFAPYCDKEETFCDGGFNLVRYENMKVWHRNAGDGHHIYDIFITKSEFMHAPTGYYRWEERTHAEKGKEIVLRNVQYVFPNTTEAFCLEHVGYPASE